jgi:glycosyltransferase involved in cell wall biosynthesis
MQLPKLQPVTGNQTKKPKILLLGDDFRLPSGIGTVSKEIILNSVKDFDWVQIGGAVNHPDAGKMFDLSQEMRKETGVEDADVKLVPFNGYGDRNILFALIQAEKPDAILHFTDPRYWGWLYQLEHEIKTTFNLPIMYYSIWDDLPYPMWNAPFYGSCDLIMGISKQSDNIHREVLEQNGFGVYDYDAGNNKENPNLEWDEIVTGYVPHGLNDSNYKPLSSADELYQKYYSDIKQKNDIKFLVFWNNRNIRRKQPGDVILAFKHFRDQLPKDEQDSVGLLMHTQVIDNNGTDLRAIWKCIAPDSKIIFSEAKVGAPELNAMYNVSDVVVNIASNEGWGLSSTEALLSGTPIINNVTGGLQDQCKFEDKNGDWIQFNGKFSTNHKGTFKKHGSWVKPVFPSNRSLQGSPQTPYIFDDRAKYEDVAHAINEWYIDGEDSREEAGLDGRQFCLDNGLTSKQMSSKMVEMIKFLLDNPKQKRPKYTLTKVKTTKYQEMGIV